MIEFTESDYPPFLFGPFRIFSDNKEVFGAVQTTFEELSSMGIRLSERQESGSLPTAFLHQYGVRKIFAKANREISESLTPEYLQWYYIKAIEGLAHSTNTTFLILPYDSKLTPMLNVNK